MSVILADDRYKELVEREKNYLSSYEYKELVQIRNQIQKDCKRALEYGYTDGSIEFYDMILDTILICSVMLVYEQNGELRNVIKLSKTFKDEHSEIKFKQWEIYE